MTNSRRNSFQTTQELPVFTNPQIQSRFSTLKLFLKKPQSFPFLLGWLLDPVSIALASGIKGGALVCNSIHVGEIKPGRYRGNHRHHSCNETFLIWGGRTLFRLENRASEKGFAQVLVGVEDVAMAVSPAGTAHALINVDETRSTFIIGCQDSVISYDKSSSDFGVWDDLN
nr:RmlC-type cupin [Tanacetum cinerariifolium]